MLHRQAKGEVHQVTDKLIPEDMQETEPAVEEELVEMEELSGVDEPHKRMAPVGRRHRAVYAGMWGPPEIAVVAVASFLLLSAALIYLLMVIPEQRELAAGQRHRDELDRELRSAREKWGDIRSTETQVAKLLASAEDFESRALKDESIGVTALYQRINVLINAYGLRNTSGPDYVPLETGTKARTAQQENVAKRGRDKFKSLFPGIYITTTVEGSYSNVRRFIRDIESSNEFVAITSVELEPSDEETEKGQTQAVKVLENGRKVTERFRKGRYRGTNVSLRIEMAAYFRRPAEERLNTSGPLPADALSTVDQN